MNILAIVSMILVFFITIFCTGVVFQNENNLKKQYVVTLSALKFGILKFGSVVGMTLSTLFITAGLLSFIVEPQSENIMPAFYYDGIYESVCDEELTNELVEQKLAEMELYNTEESYYYKSYLYFRTGNHDLAINELKKCFEDNPKWTYAYDIGVCYSYLREYELSIKYMKRALELNPPYEERGDMMETIDMIENYFGNWISSIFNK